MTRLWNDLLCVEWDVKVYWLNSIAEFRNDLWLIAVCHIVSRRGLWISALIRQRECCCLDLPALARHCVHVPLLTAQMLALFASSALNLCRNTSERFAVISAEIKLCSEVLHFLFVVWLKIAFNALTLLVECQQGHLACCHLHSYKSFCRDLWGITEKRPLKWLCSVRGWRLKLPSHVWLKYDHFTINWSFSLSSRSTSSAYRRSLFTNLDVINFCKKSLVSLV